MEHPSELKSGEEIFAFTQEEWNEERRRPFALEFSASRSMESLIKRSKVDESPPLMAKDQSGMRNRADSVLEDGKFRKLQGLESRIYNTFQQNIEDVLSACKVEPLLEREIKSRNWRDVPSGSVFVVGATGDLKGNLREIASHCFALRVDHRDNKPGAVVLDCAPTGPSGRLLFLLSSKMELWYFDGSCSKGRFMCPGGEGDALFAVAFAKWLKDAKVETVMAMRQNAKPKVFPTIYHVPYVPIDFQSLPLELLKFSMSRTVLMEYAAVTQQKADDLVQRITDVLDPAREANILRPLFDWGRDMLKSIGVTDFGKSETVTSPLLARRELQQKVVRLEKDAMDPKISSVERLGAAAQLSELASANTWDDVVQVKLVPDFKTAHLRSNKVWVDPLLLQLGDAERAPVFVEAHAGWKPKEVWELIEVAKGIFTGMADVVAIQELSNDDQVLRIERSSSVHTLGEVSVEDARAGLVHQKVNGATGRGSVIGIIDDGCDVDHDHFKTADGRTRIECLFDQETNTEWSRQDIDARAVPPGIRGEHGTHVMSIAAAIAPEAKFVIMRIAEFNSANVVAAARFIFSKANGRPCVVNISLGNYAGPHDGTNLAEKALDIMVKEASNRAVVVAAGNSFNLGLHKACTVAEGQDCTMVWQVRGMPRQRKAEIWFKKGDYLDVEIFHDATRICRVEPGQSMSGLSSKGGAVQVNNVVAPLLEGMQSSDNLITVTLDALCQGDFLVRLHGFGVAPSVPLAPNVNAWIEREDGRQVSYFADSTQFCCLSSIANGLFTIAVASHCGRTKQISAFSSAGPTRIGAHKPELTAPGEGVVAARSGTANGVTEMSGTSMAAPVVAGVIALMYEAAGGEPVSIEQVRACLFRSARQSDNQHFNWDRRYGYGAVDALGAVEAIRLGRHK